MSPASVTSPSRDELAIKLALAVTAPGVDVRAVVQAQRAASMRSLQEYTRLSRGGGPAVAEGTPGRGELAWRLVLDSLVFAVEAEIRWLDHVEHRLARAAAEAGAASEGTAPAPVSESAQVTR